MRKKMQSYRSNAKCNFNEMQIVIFECELTECEMRSVKSECVQIAKNFDLRWKKCFQCEDLINNVVDSLCYFSLFIRFVTF
jgi:CRISPR/Cas system-associated endoribonuclease Cas2